MDECRAQRQSLADEFKALQSFFAALGDETRQQIFLALLEHETVGMRVPEITRRTHLSRPAVSHHLRILKKSGIIISRREGKEVYYRAADTEVSRLLHNMIEQVMEIACPN
mgnify:CR=1 FL=1